MKKQLILTSLIMITVCFKLNAQQDGAYPGAAIFDKNSVNTFKASPDVSAFQIRSTLPVNNYTGSINLEIPIFEIKIDEVIVPISIQYNSKGIKVDDISSSVGMNWNLNAGGNIIRNIKDIPDNKVGWFSYVEYDWDIGVYAQPRINLIGSNRRRSMFRKLTTVGSIPGIYFLYTEADELSNSSDVNGGYRHYEDKVDLNYDEYHVNAPNLNDVFIVKNNSNTEDPFVPGYDSSNLKGHFRNNLGNKLISVTPKIVYKSGNGFIAELHEEYEDDVNETSHHHLVHSAIKGFFDFKIVNDQGYTYTFNDYDVIENFYGIPDHGFDEIKAALINNYNKDVASWHLNKISSPHSSKTIEFEYENYNHSNIEKKRNLVAKRKVINNVNIGASQIEIDHPEMSMYASNNINWEKIPQKNRLKKITFPEGWIDFLYTGYRSDYPGDKRLSQIKIYNFKGDLIKEVRLSQKYVHTKDGTLGSLNRRMFLESVEIHNPKNVEQSELYSFEYNQPTKLPKRYSNEQDFLGYFNANASSEGETPQLYYYNNLDEDIKFVPFRLNNIRGSFSNIQGDYHLSSNSNSLYGLLNKVIYPTKGYTVYEYENDVFRVSKSKITAGTQIAGSARIKSQSIHNSNGDLINKVEYDYLNNEGYISTFPLLALLENYDYNPFKINTVLTYNIPKLGIELTQGSFVGYSKVRETYPISNIVKEYEYTTPKEYPAVRNEMELIGNGANNPNSIAMFNDIIKGIAPYFYNDSKNGRLKELKIYENNTLVKKLVNKYKLYRSNVIQRALNSEYNYRQGGFFVSYHSKSIFNQEFLALDTVHKTEYINNEPMSLEESYTYKKNSNVLIPKYFPFISTKTIKTTLGEDKIHYSYPFANLYVIGSTLPYPTQLETENRLSKPYSIIHKKDGELVTEEKLLYGTYNYNDGNTIFPERINISSVQKNLMNTVNNDIITIDDRDEYGNIITYHTPGNQYTTVIWGYNGNYPIVEIKNMKFQDLDLAKVNIIRAISNNTSNNTDSLINAILDLKGSLPSNTFLEYKIYKPLVGVFIKGDYNGKHTYYEYDSLNRLIKISDNDSNIIKEYEYNYE